jgi:hypothetical protein
MHHSEFAHDEMPSVLLTSRQSRSRLDSISSNAAVSVLSKTPPNVDTAQTVSLAWRHGVFLAEWRLMSN